jgi:hypothetical protein
MILALPFAVLTSRRALAPKLMRRTKAEGDVGDAFGSVSLSSMAFSLTDVVGELLLPLPCRFLRPAKAEVCVGEPDKPRDAMEVRRRCWA